MNALTPSVIVSALDRYIIGQEQAKRSVAIAIRNRWRRQQLSAELRDEVAPKNIIMIGPTGVGKTEIARRLSGLVGAPFVKVEASKYTEVGYVGRDVESIVRELVEISVNMVRAEQTAEVEAKAAEAAEERLLDLLIPTGDWSGDDAERARQRQHARDSLRKRLRGGSLEDRPVELKIEERMVPVQIFGAMGMEQMDVDLQNMFEKIMPGQPRERKLTVAEARRVLIAQECERLIDRQKVTEEAIARAENSGIVFLDELDKVAGRESGHGPDVSREGVQRDLLPIIEGCSVATKHGMVRTDHILFIAAGAFHVSKPSDLIPEMQGRFPIRVELQALTRDDFVRILTEPDNALTKQYQAMLGTEKVKVRFNRSGIAEIAEIAALINGRAENIGARRLHTVMEKLFEDVSFRAPDPAIKPVVVDAKYVRQRLQDIIADEDLSRYIL